MFDYRAMKNSDVRPRKASAYTSSIQDDYTVPTPPVARVRLQSTSQVMTVGSFDRAEQTLIEYGGDEGSASCSLKAEASYARFEQCFVGCPTCGTLRYHRLVLGSISLDLQQT